MCGGEGVCPAGLRLGARVHGGTPDGLVEEGLQKVGAALGHRVGHLGGRLGQLQELLNGLKKAGFIGSAVLVVDDGEKLHLGALCGSEGQSAGNRAGDLIKALAPLVGGKGGGKPDMARGAGADRSGKNNLLAAARAEFQ